MLNTLLSRDLNLGAWDWKADILLLRQPRRRRMTAINFKLCFSEDWYVTYLHRELLVMFSWRHV